MTELSRLYRDAKRHEREWNRYVLDFRKEQQMVDQNKMIQSEQTRKEC